MGHYFYLLCRRGSLPCKDGWAPVAAFRDGEAADQAYTAAVAAAPRDPAEGAVCLLAWHYVYGAQLDRTTGCLTDPGDSAEAVISSGAVYPELGRCYLDIAYPETPRLSVLPPLPARAKTAPTSTEGDPS